MEKLYLEQVSNNGMKNMWVWWRCEKNPEGPYFRYYLNVDFFCLALSAHEMVANGKKIKTNKGEVTVYITAKMAIDPDEKWKKGTFTQSKYLQKFFIDRVYKQKIEEMEDGLVKDTARLLGAVKQYFQLESWLPEYTGEHFHPKKGEY